MWADAGGAPRAGAAPAGAPPIRVLVVDDEPLGRLRLEDLLRDEPGVELVGVAEDGPRAVAAIRALRPDLVFLDVQMPGLTGLDVVRAVGPAAMPATIFVTAYDQYALPAFDAAAVDYLVKPFDDERFEEALRRARRRLALEGMARLRGELLAVLHAAGPLAGDDRATPAGAAGAAGPPAVGQSAAGPPAAEPSAGPSDAASSAAPEPSARPRYLERIAVEVRGRVVPVPVQSIDYITASGPYAELHAGAHRHVIREAMQTLEERLDPERFMRVHRSVIVRLALVEALRKGAGGDYELQLKGGGRLRVSRSRREALERWMGVAPP